MGLLERSKLANNFLIYIILSAIFLFFEIKLFLSGYGRYIKDIALGLIIGLAIIYLIE